MSKIDKNPQLTKDYTKLTDVDINRYIFIILVCTYYNNFDY